MAFTWGSIVGGYGRIGFDITVSNSSLETTVSIKAYFWSKYSVTDSGNSYYYNNNATSATTLIGSRAINHTVDTGSGWSTSNRTLLGSTSYTYTRGTSDKTYYCAAKLTNIDRVGGTMTVKASYTVPKRGYYTVKYDANGGSGAPSSQTKWYGIDLKLSTTKPTRTGYTFKGWATSASGSVTYASGATYTANAAVTLYAVWSKITYSVKYNANGGSGAPSTQTKTYGVTLTLSSTKPTRSRYDFQGWATSSSGSVAYKAGASYTANAAVTLYAVWKLSYTPPTITNLKVIRCDSSGNVDEDNTYAKVTFSWSCNQNAGTNAISSIKIAWGSTSVTPSVSGTSGSVSQIIGSGALDIETTYTIKVTVTDSKSGSTTASVVLSTAKILLDFKSGGTGLAIGKTAQLDDTFDVALPTRFSKQIVFDKTSSSGLGTSDPAILINSNVDGADTFYRATRTDTGTSVGFGVGSAGYNHGVWSTTLGSWLIYCGQTGSVQVQSNGNLKLSAPTQGLDSRNYGENVVLWSGARWPNETQTLTLSAAISAQPNGAIFAFSYYKDSTAQNYNWEYFFVPKYHVLNHSNNGVTFANPYRGMFKYIYIKDTSVSGHANNDGSSTSLNGIAYDNAYYVLRYILGV